MTNDDVVTLGSFGELMLTNPHFNILLNEFDRTTIEAMLATKPEQQAERERLFASVNAVRDFLAFIQEFVVHKKKLLDPEPVDQWDDPSVHDLT